jgi:hypothetical protein
MTWKEFKQCAEAQGALDTDEIVYIKWPYPSQQLVVERSCIHDDRFCLVIRPPFAPYGLKIGSL